MISIQKEIRTAEDLQTLLLLVCESYRAAVADSGQYAIDLDDTLTPPHRDALRRIAEQITLEGVGGGSSLPAIRSSVRNVFRDYKERAEQYLGELRARLEEHGGALRTLLDALTSDSLDQEKRLRIEMKRLHGLESLSTVVEMRQGVTDVAGRLETCIEELERQNRITVAGLQSEIQALQRQVDKLKAPAMDGSPVGVRERVEAESAAGNAFLMLFVRVKNLEAIRARFGADLTGRMVRCAIKRLSNISARNMTVGCWQEGVLCAVIGDPERTAVALARDANNRLSGKYVFTEGERVIEIPAQIVTTSLERQREETPARTAARISEVLTVLA